jgi:hypothetical protein
MWRDGEEKARVGRNRPLLQPISRFRNGLRSVLSELDTGSREENASEKALQLRF